MPDRLPTPGKPPHTELSKVPRLAAGASCARVVAPCIADWGPPRRPLAALLFSASAFPVLVMHFLLALPGCAESGGAPVVPPQRQEFIATVEPEGATSIAKAKAAVAQQGGEVVLVGQILVGQFDPFHQDKASFVLTELQEEGHAHQGKDHKDCPFCKRRAAKAPKVVVQCQDATGKLLPIDSRKLLGIAPDQVIVVRGQGKVEPTLDLFTVVADRIYIRQK